MSIKLEQIQAARKQIGEAWSQLEQARQTLERLGFRTGLQDHQVGLYTLAMKLEEEDSCEGENAGAEPTQPAKAEAA